MENGALPQVLMLEEWNAHELREIDAKYSVLSLGNRAGTQIGEAALRDALLQVEGRRAIKSLRIDADSQLQNLTFLQAFPELETLQVHGGKIRSLNGLEWFQNGQYLEVNTGKNRARDIGKITEAPITAFRVHWGNQGDQEAIARCRTIRRLSLADWPELSLDRWQDVPIEAMDLGGGTIRELADTRYVGLTKLVVGGCRHLERFEGDNSTITWAVIQSCNRIDWRTITTLRCLVNLNITGVTAEIPLSAFVGLRELRTLSFGNSKLNVDAMDLKSAAPQLEKLYAQVLKKEQLLELSRVNSGVLVSNGRWTYRDGAPAESK